ncbi:hypothetical protein [Jiangella rhizosphaerae]|uniref:Uncharacterized protein n=1 Tax=Jiangella rhizosphaerae TaxID=2293569 RepID=A0A418KP99_9ACTN|nr:hypothetical protein [Jiangella rhizosphaerae]RIQ21264.1 hypothetical protein DY240_15695 [Jiangella rhizosphaerae]
MVRRRQEASSMPPELSTPAYIDPDSGWRWMSPEAWAYGRAAWEAGDPAWDGGFSAPDEPYSAADL